MSTLFVRPPLFCSNTPARRLLEGIHHVWRADIAGLSALAPGGGPAIRLIEGSAATADVRPIHALTKEGERVPQPGYGFRALLDEDEKTLSPDRVAGCAHPEMRADGRFASS